ncbi:hypothetical protein [Paenibacillus eucommiae]|uniref:Uncharacterized protein n=1 Tax=Paenibacillus eucommiae TaxID=1355755 RepID=A0ABS4IP04_9BACL|nr:hypothetical protein [Paenibacillus eucommiae]MBP1989282.1 hypothetical protein [Paenibacillus eucommiae]
MARSAKYLFIWDGIASFFNINMKARQKETIIKVSMDPESVMEITSFRLKYGL